MLFFILLNFTWLPLTLAYALMPRHMRRRSDERWLAVAATVQLAALLHYHLFTQYEYPHSEVGPAVLGSIPFVAFLVSCVLIGVVFIVVVRRSAVA